MSKLKMQYNENIVTTTLPAITISQAEYERLTICYKKLTALEAMGVHEWELYDRAMDKYCVELKKLGLLDQVLCDF